MVWQMIRERMSDALAAAAARLRDDRRRSGRAQGQGGRPRKRRKTVAEGWDIYARRRRDEVGELWWSKPEKMGLDVERPEDVVPYLDEKVFSPFLGTCETILEIGPGGGRFTDILLPKCKRLIAVDTSAAMLEMLRERFAGDDRVEYQLGDGRGLTGVADRSVDAAFSYGVFVHLQHWDIFNYLLELERVLVPGGKALIQHSNTFSDLGWARFVRETPRQLNRHKLHMTFVLNSPEVMRELVTRAGLECVDTITDVVKRDCITLMRKPG